MATEEETQAEGADDATFAPDLNSPDDIAVIVDELAARYTLEAADGNTHAEEKRLVTLLAGSLAVNFARIADALETRPA